MKTIRKAALLGGLLLSLTSFNALASSETDEFLFIGAEHFAWDEYNNDHGNQRGNWVSEFGARLHIGHTYGTDWQRDSGSYYRSSHIMHAGIVRYHGGLVDVPDYDLKGHVLHVGYEYARKMGYRWRLSPKLSIAPTATLGVDVWSRGMINKHITHPTSGKEESVGFHELFFSPYAGLGVAASWHLDNNRRVTLEAGKQQPLFVVEHSKAAGLLYPKPQLNDVISLEYSNRQESGKFARLYYEDKVYEASDVNSDGWFQPESHETTIGVMVGWKL